MKFTMCVFLFSLLFIHSVVGWWHKYSHGTIPMLSGMAAMEGTTTKLFGVGGGGKLYERVLTGGGYSNFLLGMSFIHA